MRKSLLLTICLIVSFMLLVGCGGRKQVASDTPIDTKTSTSDSKTSDADAAAAAKAKADADAAAAAAAAAKAKADADAAAAAKAKADADRAAAEAAQRAAMADPTNPASSSYVKPTSPLGGTSSGPIAFPTDISTAAKAISTQDVYFDFDKYNLKDDFKPVLKALSTWLMNNEAAVLIEGHCDERGTDEYNLALGDRRARTVLNYLKSSGVPGRKLDTISYGEGRPQCRQANEECWSTNRRAHFVVGVQ